MISVMIAEYREWKTGFAARCFIILAALGGGTLLISKMHFIYLLLVATLFFMWLGWQAGSQRWNAVKFSRTRNAVKIKYPQWFGGKHLGYLSISLALGALLFPLFFLLVLLWGMPISLCLIALGIGIASGTMTLSFFILTQWVNAIFGTLLSVTIIMLWLLSGYFLPNLSTINPIILILGLVNEGNPWPSLAYIGGCLAFQAVLVASLRLASLISNKAKR